MQITMRDFPAEHTVHAPGCFDGSVGKTIPVRDDQGNVRGHCGPARRRRRPHHCGGIFRDSPRTLKLPNPFDR